MVIAISWAGTALRGGKFNLGSTVIWNLGWLIWAGATFAVAGLARRFPVAAVSGAQSGVWVGLY